jgi:hypothetical protein
MTGPRVNGDRQSLDQTSTDQIDQIRTLVGNLSEEDKQAAAAELVRDVLQDDAKVVVAAEAMKSTSGKAQQELVTQVVKSADTVEAKKAAVVEAVNTAVDGERGSRCPGSKRGSPRG